MFDQKEKFSRKGITVEFVGEAQDNEQAAISIYHPRESVGY